MKISLEFDDFVRITNASGLQWYYLENEDHFYIFALTHSGHVLDTVMRYEDIIEGTGNPEFARSFFRQQMFEGRKPAVKPTNVDFPTPQIIREIKALDEKGGVPGQLPRRKTQAMNRATVQMLSEEGLQNFREMLDEEIKRRVAELVGQEIAARAKPDKEKVTTTDTGGAGTSHPILIPSHSAKKLGVRHCFKCGTAVMRGVKKCPKCGHTELGTGAAKPKIVADVPAENMATAMSMMSTLSTKPEESSQKKE